MAMKLTHEWGVKKDQFTVLSRSLVLDVYLAYLTTWNVFLISVLQYIPSIFLYNIVSNKFGQYCFSPAFMVGWLMLAHSFTGFFLLLFDSSLQSWGPLHTCTLVCFLLLSLICFNFVGLGSCICNWTCCYSLQAGGCAYFLSHPPVSLSVMVSLLFIGLFLLFPVCK